MTDTTTPARATNRADSIAAWIFATSQSAIAAKGKAAEASEAATEAGQEATGARETLMSLVASKSRSDGWTESEIGDALALAAGRFNDPKARSAKSFATMKGEIAVAAHPNVAPAFGLLVQLRDMAWADEMEKAAAAKKAGFEYEAPCKLAFSRAYHMLVAMMRRVAKPKNGEIIQPFTTVGDVVAFARMNDPRLEPSKVERQIKALVDNLSTFYNAFPVESVKLLLDYAKEFDGDGLSKELKALYDQRQADALAAAEAAAAEDAEAEGMTIEVEVEEESTEESQHETATHRDPVDEALGELGLAA